MDLNELEQAIKNSPKNCTAEIILDYLQRGEIDAAKNHYSWDGDKVATKPLLKQAIENLIGCRCHHVIGCQKWPCNLL